MFIVLILYKNQCNLESVIGVQTTMLIYKQHLVEHVVASTQIINSLVMVKMTFKNPLHFDIAP